MRFTYVGLLLALVGCTSASQSGDHQLPLGGFMSDNIQQLGIGQQQARCQKVPAPSVGMTRAQVRASCWGAPKGIMESDTALGKMEILAYPQGTIYMSNGKVTKIEPAT